MPADTKWSASEMMGLTDVGEMLPGDALALRAEESILRSALVSGDRAALLPLLVSVADFASPSHALVFRAVADVVAADTPVSEETVAEALRARGRLVTVGGVEFLERLTGAHVTHANFETHARMVREGAAIRRAAIAARKVVAMAESGSRLSALDTASREIVTATASEDVADFVPFAEVIQRTLEYLDSPRSRGLSTGLSALDRQIGGLRPGQLIVVGARPAMGKSALAQTITTNVAASELRLARSENRFPRSVVFASLEMEDVDLGARALSPASGVNLGSIAHGRMSIEDRVRVYRVSGGLGSLPIQLASGKPSVSQLRARCHRLAARTNGVAAVVVDYLQLFPSEGRGGGDNREREVAEWSRSLKLLAGELKCPVISLSQLNRSLESRANKRPMLSDLRESGAVEQDADVVMFVYRDEVYNEQSADKGVAELIIAKQRQGAVGTVRVAFDAAHAWFCDTAEDAARAQYEAHEARDTMVDAGADALDAFDPAGEGLPGADAPLPTALEWAAARADDDRGPQYDGGDGRAA